MARILIAFAGVFIAASALAFPLDKTCKKTELQVGSRKITAYIADTDEKRERGLMFIEKMPEDTGMLFVFEEEEPQAFWMKNTLIPLAIGYFDSRGKLIDIQEMKVADSLMNMQPPSYPSRGPAQFALEMNRGWFQRHGIKVGARLHTLSKAESPLLMELLPPPPKASTKVHKK